MGLVHRSRVVFYITNIIYQALHPAQALAQWQTRDDRKADPDALQRSAFCPSKVRMVNLSVSPRFHSMIRRGCFLRYGG